MSQVDVSPNRRVCDSVLLPKIISGQIRHFLPAVRAEPVNAIGERGGAI